jgi:hypothetical protein
LSSDDFDDPDREAAWIREQREAVLEYLAREDVKHAGVPERPDWLLPPHVAIGSVGSSKRLDAVGWWAISGDVLTDYMSSSEIRDARVAMRVFSRPVAEGFKGDGSR